MSEPTRDRGPAAPRLRRLRRGGDIVTFHVTRCGSRVLGDMLGQHPDVLWDAEIYAPERMRLLPRALAWALTRLPERNLDLRMLRAGRRRYGHEVIQRHLDAMGVSPAEYLKRMDARGFDHVVWIQRDNLLRVVVSQHLAQARGRWHQRSGDAALDRIELPVERCLFRGRELPLLRQLEDEAARQRQVDAALEGRRFLHLTYERDLETDPRVGYRRVCEFVGLRPHPARVQFRKTNPFSLRELLTNYDAVAEALAGSPFERMVDDAG
jgi:hypothetical protein